MSIDIVTPSSGNVFADIGVKNPEEALAKAKLILSLRQAIDDRGLTQVAAADLLGLKQPDLSKLLRGRSAGFSLERIIDLVRRIGSDVEIRVKRASPVKHGSLVISVSGARVPKDPRAGSARKAKHVA